MSDATCKISPLLFYAWVEITYRESSPEFLVASQLPPNWRFVQKKGQQTQSAWAIFWN